MKRFQAIVAAALTTALIALGMVVIGADAASNTNTVPVSNSPSSTTTLASNTTAVDAQTQLGQLQSLINQYQDREKQYQTEINNLSQKLSQANGQVDQLQQILLALQQRGVIQITQDGQVLIRGR
jgi:peptidoglycan hydrolase CwlO-like protein